MNSLTVMSWKEGEQRVNNLVAKLRLYEESISSSLWVCILSMESLSQDLLQFKEDYQQFKEVSHALPVQTRLCY